MGPEPNLQVFTQRPFRAALQHQLLSGGISPPAMRCLISSPQQDSRSEAVHKEICLSHVSGISSEVYGLTQAILDFKNGWFFQANQAGKLMPLGDVYTQVSICAKSDQISQRQRSKALVGRQRKTGGQQSSCEQRALFDGTVTSILASVFIVFTEEF